MFHLGPDVVLVKIDGTSILFGNTSFGALLAPIDGIQLSKAGVEKEFPDLKDNVSWREEAIKRFKEKIAGLPSERQRADYIIADLQSHGYIPKMMQVGGFRPVKL